MAIRMSSAAQLENTLELEELRKSYGGLTPAVDAMSLVVSAGEFFCLLGASGCGKTTTLHMIAGFIRADHGDIRVGGRSITRLPARRRNIGVVFQDYALFPHLTARDNIAYGLRIRRMPRPQIQSRTDHFLQLIRLSTAGDRRPGQLSGGEQQRVAVARALAIDPALLLLDEPLSNLDARLRIELGGELKRIQRETNVTTLMVTHDQQEAFGLADRIGVMNQGRLEQVGTPAELYQAPATPYVARFIGNANLLDGQLVRLDGRTAVRVGDRMFPVADQQRWVEGDQVTVMIRPENVQVSSGCSGEGCLHGSVVARSCFGPYDALRVQLSDAVVLDVRTPVGRTDGLARVHLSWDSQAIRLLPK